MTIKTRVDTLPYVDWSLLPLMLGEKEAAAILGVSVSFLRKSRSEGARKGRTPAPPFVCVGGRRYYRAADLRVWVDNLAPRQAV